MCTPCLLSVSCNFGCIYWARMGLALAYTEATALRGSIALYPLCNCISGALAQATLGHTRTSSHCIVKGTHGDSYTGTLDSSTGQSDRDFWPLNKNVLQLNKEQVAQTR